MGQDSIFGIVTCYRLDRGREIFCTCPDHHWHPPILLYNGYHVCFSRVNPSAWGHLNPSSYCDVGRFFIGYLNFEQNCAVVYSKFCSFINNGWISLKLETEYLGMSNLFEYAIKSYLRNLTLCGMP
jgi:hypothetical protein